MKNLIIGILDPTGDIINSDSKQVLSRKLSEFKRREDLLTDPVLSSIINKSGNRGAVLQAMNNDTTTIGNLLAILGDDNESELPRFSAEI